MSQIAEKSNGRRKRVANWHKCSTCFHRNKLLNEHPCHSCGDDHICYMAIVRGICKA